MKKLLPGMNNRIVVLCIAVIVTVSSCRISRETSAGKIRPLAPEKLLEQVDLNAFDYTDLTIRRINVQYSTGNTKTSFRVNLKAIKDEMIMASVSKLSIPVGRILLTPAELTYVNYIDRNYFTGDYSFLADLININLSFETIQAIISNRVVPDGDGRQYSTFVENGQYVLQTGKNNQEIKGRLKSLFATRSSGTVISDQEVVQTMCFNPRNFALEKLILTDSESDWTLEAEFRDFQRVEKKDYPGTIDLKMVSPEETTELKIKLNGFSTEKIDSIGLNIPDSYERIRQRR